MIIYYYLFIIIYYRTGWPCGNLYSKVQNLKVQSPRSKVQSPKIFEPPIKSIFTLHKIVWKITNYFESPSMTKVLIIIITNYYFSKQLITQVMCSSPQILHFLWKSKSQTQTQHIKVQSPLSSRVKSKTPNPKTTILSSQNPNFKVPNQSPKSKI